jgi:hypothetical protein
MSTLLDNVLVAAALAASAVYALFKLGPRALRRAMIMRAAAWAGRAPGWCGLRGLASRLGAAASQSSGSCGGCDNCGSDGAAAKNSPSAGTSANGSDIRVPLANIGRRRT